MQLGVDTFPSPNPLANKPLQITDEFEAAIVLSSRIQSAVPGRYPIGKGLFPQDWVKLMAVVSEWLSPWFVQLHPEIELPKQTSPHKRKFPLLDTLQNELKYPIPKGGLLHLRTLYMTAETLEHQLGGLQDAFDIKDEQDLNSLTKTQFLVNGINIQFSAQPNQFLELNLNERNHAAYRQALQELDKAIATKIPHLEPNQVGGMIIEIPNLNDRPKYTDQTRDAKDALRFLLARRGWLTQFQNPPAEKDSENTKRNQAESSILDIRRQLGYLGIDLENALCSMGVKRGMRLIGLHIENKNKPSGWRGSSRVRLPLAVSVTVGSNRVQALIPNEKNNFQGADWISYKDAQLSLGRRFGSNLFLDRETGVELLNRVFDLIHSEDNAIVFIEAKSWRSIWPWLQNSKFQLDKLVVDRQTFYPLGTRMPLGSCRLKGVRIVRYRTDAETPAHNTYDLNERLAGYGHGVWPIRERVFYSIPSKPDSYQSPYRFTRFGEGQNKDARRFQIVEVAPLFIQPGDDPYQLALIFHTLRGLTSHWTGGMTNAPLPNHLAKGAAGDYLNMQYIRSNNDF